ncbi:hypothetical protein [Stenotrophomonas maltophilia]|uniref:hypothetical protein n=1 Tax=Stenotrophomonas maltophilia TaxID=40324 RepID=UPI0039C4A5DF
MQDEIRILIYAVGTACLLAFIHLQICAWIAHGWMRAFYVAGARWRRAGIALQAMAWVAAVAITIAGVSFLLSWMPSSWGWRDEIGTFTSHATDLATWAGLFMGSGWVWSLLQAGRRSASNLP